jgi:hypothetical protein
LLSGLFAFYLWPVVVGIELYGGKGKLPQEKWYHYPPGLRL